MKKFNERRTYIKNLLQEHLVKLLTGKYLYSFALLRALSVGLKIRSCTFVCSFATYHTNAYSCGCFIHFCVCLKEKRFAFAGFLHLLFLHNFPGKSGNSDQKNFLHIFELLIRFSYLLL